MKRIAAILFLFALFSQCYGQAPSTERKLYYLKQSENQIFTLPYSFEHINEVIMPEIVASRDSLAAHYPERSLLPRDQASITAAFNFWIESYPVEYRTYRAYLEEYYKDHVNP